MVKFFKRLFKRESQRIDSSVDDSAQLNFDDIDIKALMGQAPDDVIERFLSCKDLKITAPDSADSDIVDVVTEPTLNDEDDVVTEELAKIYTSQGLYREAIDIYRRLSLLNSEKSVYFAELIAELENK